MDFQATWTGLYLPKRLGQRCTRRLRGRRHTTERDVCKKLAFVQPVRDSDNKLATGNMRNRSSHRRYAVNSPAFTICYWTRLICSETGIPKRTCASSDWRRCWWKKMVVDQSTGCVLLNRVSGAAWGWSLWAELGSDFTFIVLKEPVSIHEDVIRSGVFWKPPKETDW